MLTSEFRGADALIAMIDRAVRQADVAEATAAIKRGLAELIATRALALPDSCTQSAADCYARRLLYRSEDHGYTVIAMTWGPEQGTPVHDHAGLWCVEAVCRGRIGIENYAVVARDGTRLRFAPQGVIEAGEGSAGHLIPPLEYHRIFNPRRDAIAVSLHVYGGEMTECGVFTEDADGWWTRASRPLTTVQ